MPEILKRYISGLSDNFNIHQAFDGFEAGRMLSDFKPGVIILDINLPGIDGYRLCRKIKSDPMVGNPVIIAISGMADPDTETKIMKEGADAFIAKPFEPRTLSEKISELLSTSGRK